jgi:hypothetical protein
MSDAVNLGRYYGTVLPTGGDGRFKAYARVMNSAKNARNIDKGFARLL